MPPPNKPGPGKRRIRKRKRRQASSSSSSSSSSSDSESDSQSAQKLITSPTAIPPAPAEERSEQSSLSDSDSSSSASDAESLPDGGDARMQSPPQKRTGMGPPQNRSPSPPSPTIHPLVTLNPTTDEEKRRDAQLREKFRKYWMASVADAFKDDLEKIQKVGCPFPDI